MKWEFMLLLRFRQINITQYMYIILLSTNEYSTKCTVVVIFFVCINISFLDFFLNIDICSKKRHQNIIFFFTHIFFCYYLLLISVFILNLRKFCGFLKTSGSQFIILSSFNLDMTESGDV